LNSITSLAVRAGRICQMAATGWLYATDAIMRFIISDFPGTKTSQGAASSRPKRKKTGHSMTRNWRHSKGGERYPTNANPFQSLS
jgi:hypothetical protein